jgi:hypothetical protein
MPHQEQRTSKRDEEVETLYQKLPTRVDSFQVKELLRSSGKIVVISGAGTAANAGCRLNYTTDSRSQCQSILVPTFQDMRKSKHTRFDRSLYSSVDETI